MPGTSDNGSSENRTRAQTIGYGGGVIRFTERERTLTFRHLQDRTILAHFRLENGALLYMRPEVQQEWKHAVLKEANAAGRISLTFRQVRATA